MASHYLSISSSAQQLMTLLFGKAATRSGCCSSTNTHLQIVLKQRPAGKYHLSHFKSLFHSSTPFFLISCLASCCCSCHINDNDGAAAETFMLANEQGKSAISFHFGSSSMMHPKRCCCQRQHGRHQRQIRGKHSVL
jgi:hypothetical protein